MARKPKPGDESQNYPQQQYGQQPYGTPPGYGYEPQPGQPPQYGGGYPPPGYQPERKKRGGIATAALVLGIIGIILAVIPFANFGAYPFVVLAIIFGLIGIRWGKAKAGLILGVLGLVATIIWSVAIGSVFNNAVNREHTVTYQVTGSIGKADIQYYSNDGSGNDSQQSQDSVPLPFTKTIKVKGDFSDFDVEANTHIGLNSPKGTLMCTLSVDGKVVSRNSSNSDANVVDCDGTGYSGNN